MLGNRQYYSLMAALRDYTFETDKKGFDAEAIAAEIRAELSKRDLRAMNLLCGWYDVVNIVGIRAGRSQFAELGNFTRQELEAGLQEPENLPTWMGRIIEAYSEPENPDYDDVDTSQRFERTLFEGYYDVCEKSGSRFMREWNGFDRNLRNVIAAHTARGKGIPIADSLVGSDGTAESLARSSAVDFGLKGELEYIDNLLDAMEQADILEKERSIDMIRWNKADELGETDHFGIDALLAYLVKVNIIHRWMSLDPKAGSEMYEKLLASMSGKLKIESGKTTYEY